jgi:iron(III) transport system substrate-binding protein
VRVERSGAERVFQRIGQEYASRIHAVDVVNTSDAAHCIAWKRSGWLLPFVPEDVAKHFPAEHKDPDGTYASVRITLCPIAYNTNLVKPQDAPRSYADLLDPRWSGKMVKAHPSYSGTILTATFQIARDIGWSFFEKLAQQKVMQMQSATDPPKKLALGERAVMADGGEYVALGLKEKGDPIEIVYPAEGTPLIVGPNSAEGQQVLIDTAGMHSVHPATRAKPGRKPLREIKLMKDDAAAVERDSEQIKKRYSEIFKV